MRTYRHSRQESRGWIRFRHADPGPRWSHAGECTRLCCGGRGGNCRHPVVSGPRRSRNCRRIARHRISAPPRLFGGQQIRKYKALSLDDLSSLDRDRMTEHRPGIHEAMELAILAARIGSRRQIAQHASSNSRPAKLASSFRGSTHVSRVFNPAAIISCASSVVLIPHTGNSGVILTFAICVSR